LLGEWVVTFGTASERQGESFTVQNVAADSDIAEINQNIDLCCKQ